MQFANSLSCVFHLCTAEQNDRVWHFQELLGLHNTDKSTDLARILPCVSLDHYRSRRIPLRFSRMFLNDKRHLRWKNDGVKGAVSAGISNLYTPLLF